MGIFDMIGQLKDLKKQMEETRDRLDAINVDATAGAGMVMVEFSAMRKLKSIEIDPSLLHQEQKTKLENFIMEAVRDAMNRAKEMEESEMKKIAGGILPGMGY